MKDYNLDLIQVLWVEDDPGVIESYPLATGGSCTGLP